VNFDWIHVVMDIPNVGSYWLNTRTQLPLVHISTNQIMKYSPISPEGKEIGFWSRITLWWFNPFVWKANYENLDYEDLFEILPDDTAEKHHKIFQKGEKISPNKDNIWYSIVLGHRKTFIISFLCSLLLILLNFVPSLLLNQLLKFLTDREKQTLHGIFLASVLLIVTIVQNVASQNFTIFMFRFGIAVEGTLQDLVYRRLLGQKGPVNYKYGELMNMMAADARIVGKFFGKINNVWQTPISIVTSFLMLYWFAGSSVFIGLFAMCIVFPITVYSSMSYTTYTSQFYKVRDERGKFINDMLHGMKLIKYFGLEEKYEKMVGAIRAREFSNLEKSAIFDVLQVFSQKLVVLSGSIITIGFYAYFGNELNVAQIFTTISFFNMLEKPILDLGDNIFDSGLAYVSYLRLESFFSSLRKGKKEDRSEEESTPLIQLEEEPEMVPSNVAISIQNGTFQFEEKKEIISKLNLTIPKGSLTCILGKTGSGKSALFHSIVGDMETVSGTVTVNGSIAICTQSPWLQNLSIRENILFGLSYDQTKYETVLNVCGLDKDIVNFPRRDFTEIGPNGSNLSGGQRHRLSLARACYSNRDIYLIDSTFSALDNHMQNHIFNACIKGYLKSKTIIIISHSITIAEKCEKTLVMDHGQISPQITEEIIHDEETESAEPNDEKQHFPKDKPLPQPVKHIQLEDYFEYFKEFGNLFLYGILFVALYAVAKLSLGGWLSVWSSNKYEMSMNSYIMVYVAIGSFQLVLIPCHRMAFIWGGMRAAKTLHNRMLRCILYSPLSFFEKTKSGEISIRFLEDQQKIDDWLPYYYNNFFMYMLYALITIVMIIVITPPALFFIVIIGAMFFAFFLAARRPQNLLGSLVERSKEPISTHFSSTLSGLVTIKTFEKQKMFISEHDDAIDYHRRSRWMEVVMFRWISMRMEALASLIVFCSAAFIVYFRDSVNPAVAALSITYALTISDTFNSMISVSQSAESGLISFQRIHDYTKLPIESDNFTETVPSDWPQTGIVEYQDVQLKYGIHLALDHVSLKIGKESVGIVGRTGSGKSSLCSTLFRFVPLSRGCILIDDIDISKISLKLLRRSISIIPQEPILLAGTLRFNIDPFQQFSDAQIWQVFRELHLDVKLLKFKLGLDDNIEEFSNFSVGEKQLFSIARTILCDTKIIVLDEPTSNIDSHTDQIIQEIIKHKFANKTVFIIAHRLTSIMNYCNRVLVLEKGKVIEFDTCAKLLENPDSQFTRLVKKMGKNEK
jgi:ABC-type multidrug transport system fused ATPase/permease subunit